MTTIDTSSAVFTRILDTFYRSVANANLAERQPTHCKGRGSMIKAPCFPNDGRVLHALA